MIKHIAEKAFLICFISTTKNYTAIKYELVVTEISADNHRSQKAHEKIGFKTIYTYHDAMDAWSVVVWDWREFQNTASNY